MTFLRLGKEVKKMAAPMKQTVKQLPAWRLVLAKWAYNKSYFPQLGMMRDDCLYETNDVKEAIRRLPRDVYDQRTFRISRALHLSVKKRHPSCRRVDKVGGG
ncbi:hypothetical protein ScPMuIL_003599 [Solemya velum]